MTMKHCLSDQTSRARHLTRGVHDQLLDNGALLLDVLERQIRDWVAMNKR